MSHELTIRENGIAEMAFAGATPWHGLGKRVQVGAPVEQWVIDAGMDFRYNRAHVQYNNGELNSWEDHSVLYRSDTKNPLAIVSKNYKIVQPVEILEFFRDLVQGSGFQIETAGTLKGGRRIWALARTGFDGEIVPGDPLKTYLLLVTSCDGSLATIAQYTSVRVVCNNTLHMSLHNVGSSTGRVSVRHNTDFNPVLVKDKLGLNASGVYLDFMARMRKFSNTSISGATAEKTVEALFALHGTTGGVKGIAESKGYKTVLNLFQGSGNGALIEGVQGTAWGLINAVTEYADFHIRAQNQDKRLDNAWFGTGAKLKGNMLALLEQV